MNLTDLAAQVISIFISALGLAVFRLIAKYVPDDPPPVPRPPEDRPPLKAPLESDDADG